MDVQNFVVQISAIKDAIIRAETLKARIVEETLCPFHELIGSATSMLRELMGDDEGYITEWVHSGMGQKATTFGVSCSDPVELYNFLTPAKIQPSSCEGACVCR